MLGPAETGSVDGGLWDIPYGLSLMIQPIPAKKTLGDESKLKLGKVNYRDRNVTYD